MTTVASADHRIIMQAFLAGRCLAELERLENAHGGLRASGEDPDGPVDCFDAWVKTLMDHHHPEKLTAHLALTFAAIQADERSLQEGDPHWDGLAQWIVSRRRMREFWEQMEYKARR